MMNMFRYLLCLFFLMGFSSLIFAQEQKLKIDAGYERQLNVSEFINLKVYSGIEVKLIPANENKLLIHGEDRMDVVAKLSLIHISEPTRPY